MLSYDEETQLIKDYLKNVGNIIKKNREKKNISQQELATYIHVNRGTIGKYENGEMDMRISKLPLISLYCDFPLSEYAIPDYSKRMSEHLNTLIKIKGSKYKRQSPDLSRYGYMQDMTSVSLGRDFSRTQPEMTEEEIIKHLLSRQDVERVNDILESAYKLIAASKTLDADKKYQIANMALSELQVEIVSEQRGIRDRALAAYIQNMLDLRNW